MYDRAEIRVMHAKAHTTLYYNQKYVVLVCTVRLTFRLGGGGGGGGAGGEHSRPLENFVPPLGIATLQN